MNGPVSDKPRTMRRLIWVALGAVLIVLAVALASEDAGWKVLGYLVYLLILVLTNPKAAAVAAVCLLLALVAVLARRRAVRGAAAGLLIAIVLGSMAFLWWPALTAKSMTYEDVKDLKYRVIAKGTGVAFDVPVSYSYDPWTVGRTGRWPHPDKDEAEGRTRRTVDYIIFRALLPDLEPFTAENAHEFTSTRGWGRRIRASITQPMFPDARFWRGLVENTYPRLERLPDLPEVPGMLRFRDYRDELYLSHDHATDDLILMKCGMPAPDTHPHCDVWQVATITGARFRLEYTFSRNYLLQWREIDAKVKALFERFAADAARQR